MILTLENYWEGFGGIDKKLEALGMDSGTHNARSKWYTNETCKAWYKSYASHLINRTNSYTGEKYKDDTTLFAWGLMNEARFQDSGEDYSSRTLRAWVDEMGAYVKSLDPNHMVSIELEGHGAKYGFGNDEGNNFVYVQQSPYVDYCSIHIYPDEEWCDMSLDTTKRIMQMLIDDAHNQVGKPVVVGEFNGKRSNPKLIDYWKAVLGTLYDNDGAGFLFWNYSLNYIDKHTVNNGDGVLDYFKEMVNKYADRVTGAPETDVDTDTEITVVDGRYEFEYATMSGKATKATPNENVSVSSTSNGKVAKFQSGANNAEYKIDIAENGTYEVKFVAVGLGTNQRNIQFYVDDNDYTEALPYTNWTEFAYTVELTEGEHTIGARADGAWGWQWEWSYIDYMEITLVK